METYLVLLLFPVHNQIEMLLAQLLMITLDLLSLFLNLTDTVLESLQIHLVKDEDIHVIRIKRTDLMRSQRDNHFEFIDLLLFLELEVLDLRFNRLESRINNLFLFEI